MIAILVVLLQTLACLGYGALILRATGVNTELPAAERVTWALGLGTGVVGWLAFPLGIGGQFNGAGYGLLLGPGVIAAAIARTWLCETWREFRSWQPDRTEAALLSFVAVMTALFLASALAPPTDADSLTYHFYVAKDFDRLGRIEFIPRAVDGAVPMLVQLSYVPVYGLGGETAMTLWTFVTGLISALLLFTLARRHLEPAWSLALVALYISVPAYVYGAGSGQVEVRLVAFVMIAAFSLQAAMNTGRLNHVVVCAIAVGFFMGAKYTGLIFALACGIVIVMQRRWLSHGLVLTLVACVVGGQWYLWNAINTGDPVFPMLFETLHARIDYRFWDAAQHRVFVDTYLTLEKVLAPNLLNLIAYPVIATFFDSGGLEASKTGLGPFAILALPFAAAGLWRARGRIGRHPLFVVGALVAVFYVAWFFAGSPQRVRHLLPFYPLVLIVLGVAASSGARSASLASALGLGIAAVLVIQLGGAALFSYSTVMHLIRGESRAAYLERSITGFAAVNWLNTRLGSTDRVLTAQRELSYLLGAPTYFAHPYTQALVRLETPATDTASLARQLSHVSVTYLLLPERDFQTGTALQRLVAKGCVRTLETFATRRLASRTLSTAGLTSDPDHKVVVARFIDKRC